MTTHMETSRAPRQSHLSGETLERFRALLSVELASHAAQLAELEARSEELVGVPDVGALTEREVADVSAARTREALQQTEEALGRIAAGTYGWCEGCGSPIPIARLEAVPHATSCVTCASALPRR